MTTNKRLMVLAMAVLGVAMLVPARGAQAQEVQISGPLAGAPAVMRMRLYRKGRLEVKPFAGITLQDEFSRTVFTGGQLAYYLTDWLGIGVFGAVAAANLDTGLTDQVSAKGLTAGSNLLSLPTRENFAGQIGQLNWMGGVQAIFIPLRGKLGLFERLFVDTDFYISGGVAFVGLEERTHTSFEDARLGGACASRNEGCRGALAALQTVRDPRVVPAPTLAAGLSLYMADFLALNIEWRAIPFSWNTSGTDVAGDPRGTFPDRVIDSQDQQFRFNHMVSVGLSFFLPTAVEVTHVVKKD